MVFKWHLMLWILQKVTGRNGEKNVCLAGGWRKVVGEYEHLYNLPDLGFLFENTGSYFFLQHSNSNTLHSGRPKVLPG